MNLFDPRSLFSRFVALGLFLVLAGGVTATAQPTVSLRGNVGASFFQSPDLQSDLLNSGTSFGLEAAVQVYRGVGITVGGGYDGFTLNEETARIAGSPGGDLSFLSGTLGLRYTYLNDSDAHPYLTAGAGVYQRRNTNRLEVADGQLVEANEQMQESRMGLHVALGSVFRLDDTYAVFFEPRYVFYDFEAGGRRTNRYFSLRLGVDVRLYSPAQDATTPPR